MIRCSDHRDDAAKPRGWTLDFFDAAYPLEVTRLFLMTTLKDFLHENIHESGVPIKQLCDILGISYSYLANAGNPNLEEFNFQLKHLIPLTKATDCFATLDYIERALGRVAFVVPLIGVDVSEVTAELAAVTREFSHLMKELSAALADGRVQSQEWPAIARECDHLITRAARLSEAAKNESRL